MARWMKTMAAVAGIATLASTLTLFGAVQTASADAIDDIRKRGKLIVGVKADYAPWGLAVKKGEAAFAALMSGMIVKWHTTGRILELEAKYGLEQTPFAKKMHDMFLAVNPSIER